jgi:integrase
MPNQWVSLYFIPRTSPGHQYLQPMKPSSIPTRECPDPHELPGAQIPKPSKETLRLTQYKAARDYRTRGAERNKQIIPFGGRRATLYHRSDVGSGNWYLRMFIREERRHYRKSLETSDRLEALKRAEIEMITVLGKLQTGQRILAVSLKDLVRRYALRLEEKARDGTITRRTLELNRHRLKWGCAFLKEKLTAGLETKVTSLKGTLFEEYLHWRRAKVALRGVGATIRKDVVRDELLAIRKMFNFARKEKLCTDGSVPTWSIEVEKEGPQRRRMTSKNYMDARMCLHEWAYGIQDDQEGYRRQLVETIVSVMSMTGMRSGEVFGLKNSDVEIRESEAECVISIRAKTSKVLRSRRITLGAMSRRKSNHLINWIQKVQRHKSPSDFLFSPYRTGSRSVRDYYYHAYKKFRVRLKEIGLEWFDTYHCRHHWITTRLLAGDDIYIVAKVAGTSVAEIEGTYSHVLTEMATRKMSQRNVRYKSDNSYEIVVKDWE